MVNGTSLRATSIPALLASARDGHRGALGRLLSLVEHGGTDGRSVVEHVLPLGGNARTIGMTGAPGAGKSTLTGRLIGELRNRRSSIAVLAVDPTSPYSGGAILGDRLRMDAHTLDAGVYVRSMASRGSLGGLSLAVPNAIRVLDAVGFDQILVETVGVGQAEVQVSDVVDTTLVVVTPGWGDDVQAVKAGLLEVADLFVVNKCDLPGAAATRMDLASVLDMRAPMAWPPPVVMVSAADGTGLPDLRAAIESHQRWMVESGARHDRHRERLWREVGEATDARLRHDVDDAVERLRRADARRGAGAETIDVWERSDEVLRALAEKWYQATGDESHGPRSRPLLGSSPFGAGSTPWT